MDATLPNTGELLTAAADRDTRLRERFATVGIDPQGVTGVRDLDALPVMGKDDLVGTPVDTAALLTTGAGPAPRVFQSPGPLYEIQPPGPDPWRWAEVLRDLGVQGGDVVLNCFGYHLSPAGAMFDEAITAAGATVLPGGIGNQDLQVRAIGDLGVRGYIGLPSYLKALIDRFVESEGQDASGAGTFPVEYALVTAEPLPPSLREALEEHVATVRMAYGTAEVGTIAFEDGTGPGMRLGTGIDVEVCDPLTGVPVRDGTQGEVVVSVLREHGPIVRFGTGDLSAWVVDDSGTPVTGEDGRARLAGVLGRTGQAIKVRGMFLHPRQAHAALAGTAGVDAFRFVIDRADHKDTVVLEYVGQADPDGLAEQVRSSLRFRVDVRAVDALPDDAGVLDDRRTWD
ncbi:phenylacetate--CoA ligase family protein [Brevibacterium litoralis]|uniref:phenylacetate--CoA ligase family protein n=1 Tax=Brevibacterium litoralis TaxID=3138935 RepID=UPI0032F00E5B